MQEKSKQPMSFDELKISSYLSGNNADYLEELYESFLHDPESVIPKWREYFYSLSDQVPMADVSHSDVRERFREMAMQPRIMLPLPGLQANKQEGVDQLIQAYQRFGHFNARLDPLGSVNPS